ncbi:MAG: alpha/beta hydrolase [Actinomycetota bacterium]
MIRSIAAGLALAVIAASCGNGDAAAPPLITTTTTAPSAEADTEGSSTTASSTTSPAATGETDEATGSAGGSLVLPAATARQVACPAAIAGEGVACGLVDVARDITDGRDDTITVSIATLAGYDSGFRTPMVVMQGGPGGASTDFAGWLPQQAYTQVFVDQRGTGFVAVDGDCPEFDASIPVSLEVAASEAASISAEAVAACAERANSDAALDTVLDDATTQNHAYDVGQVMAALGYERWIAYGVSYGSTIGFELLRQPPEGLVGVVLDGVYPPDLDVDAAVAFSAEASIGAVGDACRRSTICSDYDADVESTLAGLIASLEEAPRTVTLSANESGLGQTVDVYLDGARAAEFVFFMLYSESLVRFLPSVLAGVEAGDESAERWLARVGTRVLSSAYAANDEATYFSVQCHDRLPFTDDGATAVGVFGEAMTGTPLREICPAWDKDVAYEISGTPVTSDLPTLLLSGEFDPITPPAYAEQAAQTLERSTVVTQAGRGHGIWIGDECIASIVQAFVADPERQLDTGCAAVGRPVDWARP